MTSMPASTCTEGISGIAWRSASSSTGWLNMLVTGQPDGPAWSQGIFTSGSRSRFFHS